MDNHIKFCLACSDDRDNAISWRCYELFCGCPKYCPWPSLTLVTRGRCHVQFFVFIKLFGFGFFILWLPNYLGWEVVSMLFRWLIYQYFPTWIYIKKLYVHYLSQYLKSVITNCLLVNCINYFYMTMLV